MGNKGAANRCKWVNLKKPAYIRYHDTEWGVPQHKDEVLFEMLFLEWFQAVSYTHLTLPTTERV